MYTRDVSAYSPSVMIGAWCLYGTLVWESKRKSQVVFNSGRYGDNEHNYYDTNKKNTYLQNVRFL